MWAEELQRGELSRDVQKADQLLRLHNESVQHMQNTTFQVLQRGQELAQVGGDLVVRLFSTLYLLAVGDSDNTSCNLYYIGLPAAKYSNLITSGFYMYPNIFYKIFNGD
jgi:hypothetical protein